MNTTARNHAEQKEQEALTKLRNFEASVQENARQLSVEIGVRQMLENQVRELRNEHVAVNAQMEATRSEMKMMQISRDDATSKVSLQAAEFDTRLAHEKQLFHRELERLLEDKVSLESEVKTLRERVSSVRDGDLEELCTVKREAEVLRLRLKELSNQGTQTVAQKDKLIEELQEKVKVGDKLRRTMHNTIQVRRSWWFSSAAVFELTTVRVCLYAHRNCVETCACLQERGRSCRRIARVRRTLFQRSLASTTDRR